MFRWLKNHFIPHEGNQHHPHILRTEAVVFLLGLAIFAEMAFLLAVFVVFPQTGFLALIAPDALVRSANAARQDTQELALSVSPLLQQAAQLKADDMAANGYFAHTSPAGITPWYWLGQVGYRYSSAGENLAVDFIDSSDVHRAWMNSPGHRANILNAGYTEIGIATATGTYQGHETIFAVQFFGKPAQAGKPRVSVIPTPLVLAATSRPITAIPKIVVAFPVAQAAESSMIEQVAAAPRKTINWVLVVIGFLVILALALTVIIKMELPHPRVAILPMALVLVLLTFIVVNRKLALLPLDIL